MAGAAAGPALAPERPADRLDAVRETSKREVEPAREKRERVAASLREDPLPHALVERPFVPILPRSCCRAERKARARALLDDRESSSKGRGPPVNLSSCSPA